MPEPRDRNRGVDLTRKDTLVSTLAPIIPKTRLKFWQELDVYRDPPNDGDDEGAA